MKECMVGIPGILLTVCEFCSIMIAIDRTWQKKLPLTEKDTPIILLPLGAKAADFRNYYEDYFEF